MDTDCEGDGEITVKPSLEVSRCVHTVVLLCQSVHLRRGRCAESECCSVNTTLSERDFCYTIVVVSRSRVPFIRALQQGEEIFFCCCSRLFSLRRRRVKMEEVESECTEALESPTTPGFAAALLKHHDT